VGGDQVPQVGRAWDPLGQGLDMDVKGEPGTIHGENPKPYVLTDSRERRLGVLTSDRLLGKEGGRPTREEWDVTLAGESQRWWPVVWQHQTDTPFGCAANYHDGVE